MGILFYFQIWYMFLGNIDDDLDLGLQELKSSIGGRFGGAGGGLHLYNTRFYYIKFAE